MYSTHLGFLSDKAAHVGNGRLKSMATAVLGRDKPRLRHGGNASGTEMLVTIYTSKYK